MLLLLLLRLSANEDCCMSSYPVLPRKTGALSRSSRGYFNRDCIQKLYKYVLWTLNWNAGCGYPRRNIPRVYPMTPAYT